jgi:hypothetical protein
MAKYHRSVLIKICSVCKRYYVRGAWKTDEEIPEREKWDDESVIAYHHTLCPDCSTSKRRII